MWLDIAYNADIPYDTFLLLSCIFPDQLFGIRLLLGIFKKTGLNAHGFAWGISLVRYALQTQ